MQNQPRRDKQTTSMRLPRHVMKALLAKARRTGVSRTQYVEQLIRRDLGLPAADAETAGGDLYA